MFIGDVEYSELQEEMPNIGAILFRTSPRNRMTRTRTASRYWSARQGRRKANAFRLTTKPNDDNSGPIYYKTPKEELPSLSLHGLMSRNPGREISLSRTLKIDPDASSQPARRGPQHCRGHSFLDLQAKQVITNRQLFPLRPSAGYEGDIIWSITGLVVELHGRDSRFSAPRDLLL